MTSELSNVINLLGGEHSPPVTSAIIGLNLSNPSPFVWIKLNGWQGNGTLHELRQRSEWERLGAAFGSSTTVRLLDLRKEFIDTNRNNNNISAEAYQCIEALLGGIQSNTSINHLSIDMALFPCDGSLPELNLREVQFKSMLNELTLEGLGRQRTINNDQVLMIETFMENTSLDYFRMVHVNSLRANKNSFRRIMLACSNVKTFYLGCTCLAQYAVVATLLGDSRSIVSEISLFTGSSMDQEGMSTIAEGFANNATVKGLYMFGTTLNDWGPMAKALCDTSSIEAIIRSNHTLESVSSKNTPPILWEYCILNSETNKEQVIRTKIARYYFQGEFDLSAFANNMDLKCLPRMLAMIGGGETNRHAAIFREEDNINQQSAIFRLLKCIPDICNVSSRDASLVDVHGASEGSSNKRQKVGK